MLYMALGFSWLFTAFGRIVSMLSDRGNTLYNWISLVIEAGSCGPATGLLARLRAMMRQAPFAVCDKTVRNHAGQRVAVDKCLC